MYNFDTYDEFEPQHTDYNFDVNRFTFIKF